MILLLGGLLIAGDRICLFSQALVIQPARLSSFHFGPCNDSYLSYSKWPAVQLQLNQQPIVKNAPSSDARSPVHSVLAPSSSEVHKCDESILLFRAANFSRLLVCGCRKVRQIAPATNSSCYY